MKIKKRQNTFLIFFFFLSLKNRKGREKNVIFKQRWISTGLPSRAFGGQIIFFKAVFLTIELPWSLHWPLSPYLAAQPSEMLVRRRRRSRRERRGRRACVRMTSLHLLLPVEGFSSTGSRICPPTQSYCSQECELETWGHISLKKSRGTWCISSSSGRAESFEGHCSIHLQRCKVLCFAFRALSLSASCYHTNPQNQCFLYSSIKLLLSPTLLKIFLDLVKVFMLFFFYLGQ